MEQMEGAEPPPKQAARKEKRELVQSAMLKHNAARLEALKVNSLDEYHAQELADELFGDAPKPGQKLLAGPPPKQSTTWIEACRILDGPPRRCIPPPWSMATRSSEDTALEAAARTWSALLGHMIEIDRALEVEVGGPGEVRPVGAEGSCQETQLVPWELPGRLSRKRCLSPPLASPAPRSGRASASASVITADLLDAFYVSEGGKPRGLAHKAAAFRPSPASESPSQGGKPWGPAFKAAVCRPSPARKSPAKACAAGASAPGAVDRATSASAPRLRDDDKPPLPPISKAHLRLCRAPQASPGM